MTEGAGFELGTDGPSVVVAGVDGSPTSLRAAAYAMGVARRSGARLVVVSVLTLPALAGLAPAALGPIGETQDEAGRELRERLEAFAAEAGIDVDVRELRGDPYGELSRTADEVHADTVVVGASASAGHRLIGSLAVRLVHAARWPVAVVP